MKKYILNQLFDCFLGCEIIQVCIGQNEIIFNLYPAGFIRIESTDLFYNSNAHFFEKIYINGLKNINGNNITKINNKIEFRIEIELSNKKSLLLEYNDENHESITFCIGDNIITI